MSDTVTISTLHLPGAVKDRIAWRSLARLAVIAFFFLALGQAGLRPAAAHAQTAVSEKVPSPQSHPARSGPATPTVAAIYGGLPLGFEANQGQADQQVKFLARGQGYGFYLTANEAVLALSRPLPRADRAKMQKIAHWRMLWPFLNAAQRRRLAKMSASLLGTDTLRMKLIGANGQAQVSGSDELPGTTNYFLGNDPARWRTHVPAFAKVHYTGVYPGIDLIYYGNQRRLEYDFVVAPHANPGLVELHFSGAQQLRLDDLGDLHISGSNGEVAFEKPVIYQDEKGQHVPVKGRYVLFANHTVGFKVGKYDHGKALVIDPTLSYSTYLGGSTDDAGTAITVDAAGSIYVVGFTSDADFPVTTGAFQTTNTVNNLVAFVAKLNAAGSALVYSTYLGGTASDSLVSETDAFGIAVDRTGSAYICGETYSNDFPVTTGAFQTQNKGFANDAQNAFISKLSPDGTALSYSTYLGGSGLAITIGTLGANFFEGDSPLRMTVDTAGSAYVVGTAYSTDFPTTSGAYQLSNKAAANFASNAFVAKLSPNGSSLVYSTYLGGSGVSPSSLPINDGEGRGEAGYGIAVDTAGEAYATGYTFSANFPVTANSYQQVNHGTANVAANVFVSKFNATGTSLVGSTYLGGTGRTIGGNGDLDVLDNGDDGIGVALDTSGDAYLIGVTSSTDFPTSTDAYQTTNKAATNLATNLFVSKLDPTLSTLMYSTYIGGSGVASPTAGDSGTGDFGTGIAIDTTGDAYITGATESRDFPVTSDAFQSGPRSAQTVDSGFFTEVNSNGSALQYSTYLGGSGAGAYGGTQFSYFQGDFFYDITLDGFANAYLTGYAYSYDFPVTKNGLQTVNNAGGGPGGNSFIAKFGATAGVTFLPTTTTLSSTTAGANITFTAVVKPVTATGVPSGTVNFYVNSVKATTVTLDPIGTATYTTNQLTDSLYNVIAAYSGDATYGASGSSVGLIPATGLPATTLTLIANPTSSVVGQSVTLTATLAPFNGDGFITDGETVTFFNGGATIGTGTLSGGVATFSTGALPAGLDILTAFYPGDTNLAASVSQPLSYTVSQRATTATTLAITAGGTTVTTVASGIAVTLIATVTTGDTPVNPGLVIFCDATAPRCEDSAVLGMAQLTVAGTATLKFVPEIGAHSYKAVFAGTNGDTTSTSPAQALTVTGLYSTTTAIAETGTPGSYTLTGTVVGTGSATLSPPGILAFRDITNHNASLGTATLGVGVPGLSFVSLSSPAPMENPETRSAIGDFNGDGILDVATANTAPDEDQTIYANTVTISLGNGDGTFTTMPTHPATGIRPTAIVAGDFNGDGKLDLATTNYTDGTVTILLGNGDGTFTAAATPTTGPAPYSIVAADFNRDGNLDLAVSAAGQITILLGNGDGTFTTSTVNLAGDSLASLVTADFNGDGNADLAVQSYSSPNFGVIVLLGNGDGTFTPKPLIPQTGTGSNLNALVTGDFNSDGKTDLAVTNSSENTVTILLGSGDGTFTASNAASATGTDPIDVQAADFNGDGKLDLVVVNFTESTLRETVLLGNGDGTFTLPAISTGTYAYDAVAVGDFNGDGNPDLVSTDGSRNLNVSLTQRTQTATATLASVSVPGVAGNHSVVAIYPGDTNFTTSTSASVTLVALGTSPTTSTTLGVTAAGNAVTTVPSGTAVTLTATVTTADGAPVTSGLVIFCDAAVPRCEDSAVLGTAQLTVSGTAKLNFVPGIGSHSYKALFTGTNNDVTSTSAAQTLTVTGLYPTATTIASSGTPGNYTLTGTVVGTGFASLSPTGNLSFLDTTNDNALLGTAELSESTAGLSFLNSASPAVGKNPATVATGDFNGDGIPDLAVANSGSNTVSILLGNGDGTFAAAAVSPTTGNNPESVIVADLNGDGNADLAVANNGSNSVTILLGNGNGTFTAKPIVATGSSPQSVVVGDFNGDGNQDLAVANVGSNSLTVLLGNGDGTFTAAASPSTGTGPGFLAVGDFNGDGRPDIAVSNAVGHTITILLGNGDGTFSSAAVSPTSPGSNGIVVGDFNGDGKADLAVADGTGNTVTVLLGNGDGTFDAVTPSPATGRDPLGIAVGDFNGDGRTDLAVTNTVDNTITVLLGNGDGTFAAVASPATGILPFFNIAVADFNADGIPDLATENFTSNTTTVLLTQRTQTVTATLTNVAVTTPPAGGHSVVASYPGDANFGSSTSTAVTLNPAASTPTITSLNPNAVYAGSRDTVVTITGTNFLNGAAVSVNGTNQTAIFVSATELTTTLTATQLSTAGTLTLTVVNPDGGTSSAATFTVIPPPLLLSPAKVAFNNQTVGSTSAAQVVTVANATDGALTITRIVLNGQFNPADFAQTNNCPATLDAGATCQITITFTPTGVGARSSWIEIDDNAPVPTQYEPLTGTGTGGILQVQPGNLKTIAGNGTAGYSGDRGPAPVAELNNPDGISFDRQGNLYITDELNNVIRKVDTAGNISTVAGNGTAGFSGDGGPATKAELNSPYGVTADSAGNLYIQDTGNARIREVDTTGTITTIAGNGTFGYTGDGGPAKNAELNVNQGARFDAAGNLYLADCANGAIRKIDTSGVITTVAGNGTNGFSGDGAPATSAELDCPSGVAIDATGELFIADFFNNRIRKVDAKGIITTIAGNSAYGYGGDGGPAASATLNLPNDVALDASGDLYLADTGNNRIRKIDTTGAISTVAGGLNNAGSAGVDSPAAVTVDANNNLYFSDTVNNAVREYFPAGALSFPLTAVGTAATPLTVTLSNIGNVAVEIASGASFALSGNATDFSLIGGTCLASPATLALNGGSCTLQVAFKPTAADTRNLTVSVTDNAVFSPQSFQISGTGTAGPQSITITPIAAQTYGVAPFAVVATATSGLPVTIAVQSGPATIAQNVVTLTGAGTVTLVATQAGNADYTAAPPATTSFTVNPATTTLAITASSKLVVSPATISLTATLSATVADATGTVTFLDGTTSLGKVTLSAGAAALTNIGLTIGTHSITAAYSGAANFAASTSPAVTVVVQSPVPAVVLTTISPVGATTGAGNTTITATGANFTSTSMVNFNASPLTTTFVSAAKLTAVVPSALLATVGTAAVTVTDSASESSSKPAVFTIVPSGLAVTFNGPPTTSPGEQPPLTFQLNQPYPADLAGTITLTFAPDPGNPANPQVQFASGGTTFNFTLLANTTTTPGVMVQVGTISGTITITLQLTAAGVNVTPANVVPITIVVPKAAPTISAVSISASGNTLTVLTTGFSTTREIQSATFSFTPANGALLAQKTVIVPAATLFSVWYTTAGSAQYGSAFTYSQQFTLSGSPSSVASVSVTLTNTVGTSSGVSSQ